MRGNLISVIVPVYNTQEYISECISSIISQTHENYELILVNDGSTDDSLAIVRRFSQGNTKIKVIDKQNGGVSSARNAGIDASHGKYILFVDSDDYLTDNRAIEKLDNAMREKADVTIYDVYYENSKKTSKLVEKKYTTKQEVDRFLFATVKSEQINSPFNKIYSRSHIDKYNIRFDEDIKMGEDLLFNIQYFRHCKSINYLEDTLYFYRTTNVNAATKRHMENKYSDLMYVNNHLKKWLDTRDNAQLSNVSKYIRIKNILSCLKDTDNLKSTWNESQQVMRYKSKNQKIIIRKCGIGLYVFSLLYSYSNVWLLRFYLRKVRLVNVWIRARRSI